MATVPPGSDLFATATPIRIGDISEPVDASTLTLEAGEPVGARAALSRTAWWRLEVPYTLEFMLDASQSMRVGSPTLQGDTYMNLWQGETLDALTLIAADDDSGLGSSSRLTVTLDAGFYYVQLGMYSATTTAANLVLEALVPTPGDWVQRPDQQATGSTNSFVTYRGTASAGVTGTTMAQAISNALAQNVATSNTRIGMLVSRASATSWSAACAWGFKPRNFALSTSVTVAADAIDVEYEPTAPVPRSLEVDWTTNFNVSIDFSPSGADITPANADFDYKIGLIQSPGTYINPASPNSSRTSVAVTSPWTAIVPLGGTTAAASGTMTSTDPALVSVEQSGGSWYAAFMLTDRLTRFGSATLSNPNATGGVLGVGGGINISASRLTYTPVRHRFIYRDEPPVYAVPEISGEPTITRAHFRRNA